MPAPTGASQFPYTFHSYNSLKTRKTEWDVNTWVLDSGAFTEISNFGEYRTTPDEYAAGIARLARVGNCVAAVAQDWMCEPHILAITGKSVQARQELTIARYDALMTALGARSPTYIMPVIQGYAPDEYASCVRMYGSRLKRGAYVGVGSVCKRNGDPSAVLAVLLAVLAVRPDLKIHGFGLKITALRVPEIRSRLYTADSMAWAFRARMENNFGSKGEQLKPNSLEHAHVYKRKVDAILALPTHRGFFDK